MILNLDEAIKYHSELAEGNEKDAEQFKRLRVTQDIISYCYECAKEHRQLADWLRVLKEIWDSGDCNNCKFKGMCATEPKVGQMVRYNCYGYSRKEVDENDT